MMRTLIVAGTLLAAGVTASLQACTILKMMWWMENDTADPLFRFVQKGKVGYIDPAGKIAIRASLPIQGAFGGEFHEGLLAVNDKEGTRYLDRSVKTVLRTADRGSSFFEGLAAVEKKGFIDRTGRLVIEAKYDSAGPFSEGLAVVALGSGGWEPSRVGYIDRQGRVVIPLSLSSGADFHEGRAAVILKGGCRPGTSCGRPFVPAEPRARTDCRWAFIDNQGRPISTLRFDDAGDFSEGLAAVEMGGLWGYVGRDGKIAIKPQFKDAMAFSESVAAVRKNGRWGFIDHSGAFVIAPQFESAESFSNGLARVIGKQDAPGYYIDKRGKQAFSDDFRIATPFRHGLAHVQLKDGRYAYINTAGKVVFTYMDR